MFDWPCFPLHLLSVFLVLLYSLPASGQGGSQREGPNHPTVLGASRFWWLVTVGTLQHYGTFILPLSESFPSVSCLSWEVPLSPSLRENDRFFFHDLFLFWSLHLPEAWLPLLQYCCSSLVVSLSLTCTLQPVRCGVVLSFFSPNNAVSGLCLPPSHGFSTFWRPFDSSVLPFASPRCCPVSHHLLSPIAILVSGLAGYLSDCLSLWQHSHLTPRWLQKS